jgi:predicted RNase H-like nuclease (RuvC/YqgF family)
MHKNQVANSKNYRIRQRQKIEDLTHRVEDLEASNRDLHERLDRVEAQLAITTQERDQHRQAAYAAVSMSGHRPLLEAYNSVVNDYNRLLEQWNKVQQSLAHRPDTHLSQITASMLALIRLKCAPDKLNSADAETVRVATDLIQIVNVVLDLIEKQK